MPAETLTPFELLLFNVVFYGIVAAFAFWVLREFYRGIVLSLRTRKALDENLPPLFEGKGDRRARLQAELDKLDADADAKTAREKQDRERANTRARREAESRAIEDI